MNKEPTVDAVLAEGRKFIDILKNHPAQPAPLDGSEKSFEFCQWFLSTMPAKSPDEKRAKYRSRALLGIATYLGDYLSTVAPDAVYTVELAETGGVCEIILSLQRNGKKHTINLLSIVTKAAANPESDNLPIKVPYLAAAIR